MTDVLHTKEQGLRVHKLAKLGGLVAIAGLEELEETILLGALLEISSQLATISIQRLDILRQQGQNKLLARKQQKSTIKSVSVENKSLLSSPITINSSDAKKIIHAVTGKIPPLTKDIEPELRRLLRGLAYE